ncbi:MAG TPA: pilus assembly protein PilP [Sedimenticola sp.]|nr:pilus assembly protein PilP [Sedimenticola sp.]
MGSRAPLFLKGFTSACLGMLLAACENNQMNDLQQFVEEVKSRPPGRIAPLPQIKPIETFVYTASNKRNPFVLSEGIEEEMVSEASDNGIRPDTLRRKEELEAFPLDTIRMVGTLEQHGSTWGLVQTKDGTIYRVQPGNYMGQNYGRITRILEDRIELTEILPDGQGGYLERQASLALNE